MTSRWLALTMAWTIRLRARGLPRNSSSGRGRSPTYSRWSTLGRLARASADLMTSACIAVGALAM